MAVINQIYSIDTASTNVTSGAYVELAASTPFNTLRILATDTTGKILKLAVGAAGQEVDLFQLPVNGSQLIPLSSLSNVPAGSRLSLKALGASATSGLSAITLLS